MRAAFPFDLRIGTDIIATNRIFSTLKPNQGRVDRLARRFLHPKELRDLNRRFPQWTSLGTQCESDRKQIAAWLAGRWAAKEAAKKAWGATLLSFTDLRVDVEQGGRPHILCDTAQESSSSSADAATGTASLRVTEQAAQLSISHDGDYTIATVMATPLHEDIMADLGRRKAEADSKVRPV